MQRLLQIASRTSLGLCGIAAGCYGVRTLDAKINGYTRINMQVNSTDTLSQGLSPFLGSVVTIKDQQGNIKHEEWHFRPTVYDIEVPQPTKIQIHA